MNVTQANDDYILKWQNLFRILMKEYQKLEKKEEYDIIETSAFFKHLMGEVHKEKPLLMIQQQLDIPDVVLFAIMFSFLFEIDSNVKNFVYQHFQISSPTFYEVFAIYQIVEDIHFSDILKLIPKDVMKLIFKFPQEENSLLEQKILLHHYVIKFIGDGMLLANEGMFFYQEEFNYIPIYENQYNELKKMFTSRLNSVVIGDAGSGKRSLVKRLVHEEHMQLLILDMDYLEYLPYYEQEKYIYQVQFVTLVCNFLIALESKEQEDIKCVNHTVQKLNHYRINWILCVNHSYGNLYVNQIRLPHYLENIDMQAVIKKWSLNEKILEYHYSIQNLMDIKKGIYENNCIINNPYLQYVKSDVIWDDFICEDNIKGTIQSMLYQITHKSHIKKFIPNASLSKGIQILLHGPSGSGKTMLASIMANTLKIPLYRVNLAMINDKYIGESEKHLESIFTIAEKRNCILLFDEADVLFSKRVQVNSSNDRHANSITAFLLQRIEIYQGIVVLTSNLIHNFDDAFLRRMRFIIRLAKPSKNMQKRKWIDELAKVKLKNELVLEEILDWNDLTLARIENIILHTVSLVLEAKGSIITMEVLRKAYMLEIEKRGEIVTNIR